MEGVEKLEKGVEWWIWRKGYYMGVYGDSCGGDDRVKIFCGKSQGFRCRID